MEQNNDNPNTRKWTVVSGATKQGSYANSYGAAQGNPVLHSVAYRDRNPNHVGSQSVRGSIRYEYSPSGKYEE